MSRSIRPAPGRSPAGPEPATAAGTRGTPEGAPRPFGPGLPGVSPGLYHPAVTTAGSPSAQDPVARSGLPPERLVAPLPAHGHGARPRRAGVDPEPLGTRPLRHLRPGPRGRRGRGHRRAHPGRDWFLPYYRSMTGVMAMGMTPREVMLQQYGKADDPGSGGRQMPSHYGHAGHRIFTSSSPVGTQILHAAGIALAAKLARRAGGGARRDGGGQLQPGRCPRGAQLRRRAPAADDPARREQRLRDLRAGRARDGRPRHRRAGIRLRHAGLDRRRRRRDRLLPGGARCGGASAGRRRRDADRGQGDPPHRPQLGRPADEVPLRGRAGRAARAGSAAPLPGRASGGRGAGRDDGGRDRGRGRGGGRRRDRLRRGRHGP